MHIIHGSPKSSQRLINHRHNICSSCNKFDSKNAKCMICGCNINKERILLNKLAWKDQKCPIDKW
jgi:hypothetical protein